MKKIMYRIIAVAIYGLSLSVFAANVPNTAVDNQASVAVNAFKVGVIDMRQVMEKSTQIAQIRESLRKEFLPKQQKLLSGQTTLKNDAERLRRDNAIMNNNDRKQLEQKILTEQQDLQRMQQGFQQELVTAQNKALKGFLENVKNVVEKVAKAENISLVITKDTVAYVKANLDITNKVIEELPHK